MSTTAVHAGREQFRALGVHTPPLDRSTTYPLTSLDAGTASLDAMAAGGRPEGSPVYARLHNPTVARWEAGIAQLEQADEAVAFGSGMAAMTAVLLAAGAVGRHVVAVRPLYGCTDHLLGSDLLGCQVTWASPDGVADAIRDDTALVVAETPANPTLRLIDLDALVAAAGDVPVVVDNTFATPILQRPLLHGVAWSLHSATKALSGHGDVMAGVVATSGERAAALRQVRILTGGLLDPQAAYLLHRSLPTLPLRVRAAQANAMELARRLHAHPAVSAVHYPGLPGSDPSGLVGRQMDGPGGILAFELVGGHDAAAGVMKSVELITPAVSLGSTDTLLQHPAGLTHRIVGDEGRAAGGITPGMLRLSAGIEDVEDLWADLAAALELTAG
ncbi:PLP-dependent aspartate aminotransferase family protein [Egicoccus sp. AB-alg6-2]|uniref:trans-sulfuration enzyme family protein n=1 Tax=Egicoccus sp. AB-alg6-2 TaxID=3242692 RepID=UPI00359CC18E